MGLMKWKLTNTIQYISIKGMLYTGLSSVMIMNLPKDTGVEYSAESKPMNGRLQIIGASAGQFAKTDYSPNMRVGDFYIFLMTWDIVFILLIVQKKNAEH